MEHLSELQLLDSNMKIYNVSNIEVDYQPSGGDGDKYVGTIGEEGASSSDETSDTNGAQISLGARPKSSQSHMVTLVNVSGSCFGLIWTLYMKHPSEIAHQQFEAEFNLMLNKNTTILFLNRVPASTISFCLETDALIHQSIARIWRLDQRGKVMVYNTPEILEALEILRDQLTILEILSAKAKESNTSDKVDIEYIEPTITNFFRLN
ncbi:hypothetical protein FBU30_001558 [Linnemannia zychae]|nr:hypothetical protein FBU30_001558 [Linnemannia zychae]